jgi:hypothetical protein
MDTPPNMEDLLKTKSKKDKEIEDANITIKVLYMDKEILSQKYTALRNELDNVTSHYKCAVNEMNKLCLERNHIEIQIQELQDLRLFGKGYNFETMDEDLERLYLAVHPRNKAIPPNIANELEIELDTMFKMRGINKDLWIKQFEDCRANKE